MKMGKFSGIQIEIDPDVEAIYIRLSGNRVAVTHSIEADVQVDVDSRGAGRRRPLRRPGEP